jgi:high-affinity iron transporter
MLAALIIVFREVMEAGLIVGIVLAATRGIADRGLWVGYGVSGGVAGACVVAAFTGAIADAFAGGGQELLNATILLVAVLMLGWHNVWMARHGRVMAAQLKAVGEEVASGQRTLMALAVVVGVAVLREGSEVVLFLYGVAAQGGTSAVEMAAGGAAGVLAGAGVAALMYFGLLRIPTRYLFSVTSWLIALLAAGMASQAIAFLQQAGILTAFSRSLWNTANVLSEGSLLGRVLHTLIGYSDQPSGMQLAVYLATLAAIFILMRVLAPPPQRPLGPQNGAALSQHALPYPGGGADR